MAKATSTTTKLSKEASAAWKLLSAKNTSNVRQGLALAAQSPAIIDELLAEVNVTGGGDLESGPRFKVPAAARPYTDVALLGLLSLAPKGSASAAKRKKIKSIELRLEDMPLIQGYDKLTTCVLDVKLPEDIPDLSCLSGLGSLRELKITVYFGGSGKLLSLTGMDAPRLETLSLAGTGADFSQLSALVHLKKLVIDDMALEDAGFVSAMTGLEYADLNSDNLKGLPTCWPSGFKRLDVRGGRFDAIETLPDTMEIINLTDCPNLVSLPDPMPGSLRFLGFSDCPQLKSIRGCRVVRQLADDVSGLSLDGCTGLASLEGLENISNLEEIKVPVQVPDISALKREKDLDLWLLLPDGMTDLPSHVGPQLAALGPLNLTLWLGKLSDINALNGLANIKKLDLSRQEDLKDISVLPSLTGLKVLHLDSGSPASRKYKADKMTDVVGNLDVAKLQAAVTAG